MKIYATLLMLGLCTFTAKADTTFSTFGPNDEYVTSAIYSLSNPIAFAFIPTDSGLLSGVTLALLQAPESGTTGFALSINESAGDKPGSTLWTTPVVATEGLPLTTATITSSSIYLQAGTTYWISAQADPGQFLGWYNASTDGQASFWNPVRGSWNSSSLATMSAFSLEISTIPEPSTGAACIFGLLVALVILRRRLA